MFKALIIATIFFTSYLAAIILLSETKIEDETEEIVNAASIKSAFGELKEPPYFALIGVTIKDEVLLDVEQVGLDTEGKLRNPEAWENVGWYARSAKPGEIGNVVIAGHYDTDTGDPAAFWGLKNLKVNDRVILQDEIRRNYSYRVIDIFYVDIQDPQRTQVFEETSKAELTLMTCGGVWDVTVGTYDKRLVVKAELVSTDTGLSVH